MVTEVGLRVELGYPLREQCYLENTVTLTNHARGALPKIFKESEASHGNKGNPHTGGTEEDSIGECFVSLPATIYTTRLCMEEWC